MFFRRGLEVISVILFLFSHGHFGVYSLGDLVVDVVDESGADPLHHQLRSSVPYSDYETASTAAGSEPSGGETIADEPLSRRTVSQNSILNSLINDIKIHHDHHASYNQEKSHSNNGRVDVTTRKRRRRKKTTTPPTARLLSTTVAAATDFGPVSSIANMTNDTVSKMSTAIVTVASITIKKTRVLFGSTSGNVTVAIVKVMANDIVPNRSISANHTNEKNVTFFDVTAENATESVGRVTTVALGDVIFNLSTNIITVRISVNATKGVNNLSNIKPNDVDSISANGTIEKTVAFLNSTSKNSTEIIGNLTSITTSNVISNRTISANGTTAKTVAFPNSTSKNSKEIIASLMNTTNDVISNRTISANFSAEKTEAFLSLTSINVTAVIKNLTTIESDNVVSNRSTVATGDRPFSKSTMNVSDIARIQTVNLSTWTQMRTEKIVQTATDKDLMKDHIKVNNRAEIATRRQLNPTTFLEEVTCPPIVTDITFSFDVTTGLRRTWKKLLFDDGADVSCPPISNETALPATVLTMRTKSVVANVTVEDVRCPALITVSHSWKPKSWTPSLEDNLRIEKTDEEEVTSLKHQRMLSPMQVNTAKTHRPPPMGSDYNHSMTGGLTQHSESTPWTPVIHLVAFKDKSNYSAVNYVGRPRSYRTPSENMTTKIFLITKRSDERRQVKPVVEPDLLAPSALIPGIPWRNTDMTSWSSTTINWYIANLRCTVVSVTQPPTSTVTFVNSRQYSTFAPKCFGWTTTTLPWWLNVTPVCRLVQKPLHHRVDLRDLITKVNAVSTVLTLKHSVMPTHFTVKPTSAMVVVTTDRIRIVTTTVATSTTVVLTKRAKAEIRTREIERVTEQNMGVKRLNESWNEDVMVDVVEYALRTRQERQWTLTDKVNEFKSEIKLNHADETKTEIPEVAVEYVAKDERYASSDNTKVNKVVRGLKVECLKTTCALKLPTPCVTTCHEERINISFGNQTYRKIWPPYNRYKPQCKHSTLTTPFWMAPSTTVTNYAQRCRTFATCYKRPCPCDMDHGPTTPCPKQPPYYIECSCLIAVITNDTNARPVIPVKPNITCHRRFPSSVMTTPLWLRWLLTTKAHHCASPVPIRCQPSYDPCLHRPTAPVLKHSCKRDAPITVKLTVGSPLVMVTTETAFYFSKYGEVTSTNKAGCAGQLHFMFDLCEMTAMAPNANCIHLTPFINNETTLKNWTSFTTFPTITLSTEKINTSHQTFTSVFNAEVASSMSTVMSSSTAVPVACRWSVTPFGPPLPGGICDVKISTSICDTSPGGQTSSLSISSISVPPTVISDVLNATWINLDSLKFALRYLMGVTVKLAQSSFTSVTEATVTSTTTTTPQCTTTTFQYTALPCKPLLLTTRGHRVLYLTLHLCDISHPFQSRLTSTTLSAFVSPPRLLPETCVHVRRALPEDVYRVATESPTATTRVITSRLIRDCSNNHRAVDPISEHKGLFTPPTAPHSCGRPPPLYGGILLTTKSPSKFQLCPLTCVKCVAPTRPCITVRRLKARTPPTMDTETTTRSGYIWWLSVESWAATTTCKPSLDLELPDLQVNALYTGSSVIPYRRPIYTTKYWIDPETTCFSETWSHSLPMTTTTLCVSHSTIVPQPRWLLLPMRVTRQSYTNRVRTYVTPITTSSGFRSTVMAPSYFMTSTVKVVVPSARPFCTFTTCTRRQLTTPATRRPFNSREDLYETVCILSTMTKPPWLNIVYQTQPFHQHGKVCNFGMINATTNSNSIQTSPPLITSTNCHDSPVTPSGQKCSKCARGFTDPCENEISRYYLTAWACFHSSAAIPDPSSLSPFTNEKSTLATSTNVVMVNFASLICTNATSTKPLSTTCFNSVTPTTCPTITTSSTITTCSTLPTTCSTLTTCPTVTSTCTTHTMAPTSTLTCTTHTSTCTTHTSPIVIQTSTCITQTSTCTTHTSPIITQTSTCTTQTSTCTKQTSTCTTQTSACTTQTSTCTTQTSTSTTQTSACPIQSLTSTMQASTSTTQTIYTTQTSTCTKQTSTCTTQTSTCTKQTSTCTTQTSACTTQTSACTTQTSTCAAQTSACAAQTSTCTWSIKVSKSRIQILTCPLIISTCSTPTSTCSTATSTCPMQISTSLSQSLMFETQTSTCSTLTITFSNCTTVKLSALLTDKVTERATTSSSAPPTTCNNLLTSFTIPVSTCNSPLTTYVHQTTTSVPGVTSCTTTPVTSCSNTTSSITTTETTSFTHPSTTTCTTLALTPSICMVTWTMLRQDVTASPHALPLTSCSLLTTKQTTTCTTTRPNIITPFDFKSMTFDISENPNSRPLLLYAMWLLTKNDTKLQFKFERKRPGRGTKCGAIVTFSGYFSLVMPTLVSFWLYIGM